MKRCITSLTTTTANQLTIRFHFTQTKLTKIKQSVSAKCRQGWSNGNFHRLRIGIQNGTLSFRTNLAVSCIITYTQPYAITPAITANSFPEIYPKNKAHVPQKTWFVVIFFIFGKTRNNPNVFQLVNE